jgi:apolipoprotein N-acyltransferase
VARQIQNIITDYPETEVIIMPESAFNISNFTEISDVLLWNEKNVGKKMHLIFGASRYQGNDYCNTLHWVYDGVLQCCYDKKHAMLLSERLSGCMDNSCLQSIYFSERQPIAVSCNERKKLLLLQESAFVPYICSELFFNELSDDEYATEPIIVIVNDLLFVEYTQKLLVLLARIKAIQWQREIVYVSYTQSVFIDKNGLIQPMMM